MTKKRRKKKYKLRKFDLPVGLVWYEVTTRKPPCKAPDGEPVLGFCSFSDRQIALDAGMSNHAQYVTAWHEYFHALFKEMGYNEDCGNESKVETLAQNVARAAPRLVDEYVTRK